MNLQSSQVLNFIGKYWREGIIAILIFGYVLPSTPQAEIRTVVEVKEVVKEVVKWKTRSVDKERIVTKPDGTKIEERIKSDTASGESNKESTTEKKEEVEVAVSGKKAQYGLGVDLGQDLKDYGLSARARLGESALWLKGGYSPKRGISLGLELEL